jgi:3-hydroxyisobutyrate dehydrogenase-like beta-hydroxyacid dehydrogenase
VHGVGRLSRVAVLGTGLTGAPIAARLAAHCDVTAWNRTAARAEALRPHGVSVAATPAKAVAGADVVLLVVLGEAAVDAVTAAALPGLRPGTLVVDLATTGVEATRRLVAAVESAGACAAKAPFFGSVPEAEAGALFFTVGCSEADAPRVEEALAPLGESYRVGDAETCAALKLALNTLVFTMVGLIAESLALARIQGVDPELVLEVLARGTGVRAPIFLGRGRMILDEEWEARASVELALQDLGLIERAAAEHRLRLPLTETAHDLFRRAGAAGLEGEDMAAVAKLVTG